jgi:hypothetical protein
MICFYLFALSFIHGLHGKVPCGPSKKLLNDTCVSITNHDVLRALNWVASPPQVSCEKIITIQDISVCVDNIGDKCNVWSVISSNYCDHFGSLEFEKYWSKRGCKVTIFQFFIHFKGNVCSQPNGPMIDYPNITFVRADMWGSKCFNCFYKIAIDLQAANTTIDVLKLQNREGVYEDFDGVQYTVLADLYLHVPELVNFVNQIVFIASINPFTLTDNVGREAEHAWNIWAAQRFLKDYASFDTVAVAGRNQPLQFDYLLQQAKIDVAFSYYQHSLIHVKNSSLLNVFHIKFNEWKPKIVSELHAEIPKYCVLPTLEQDVEMQKWIKIELKARCHPFRLAVPCDRSREYDAFIPCQQELMDKLAEDYAALKGWCNFSNDFARITSIRKVDNEAKIAFNKPYLKVEEGKRLAFFFTVYADAPLVKRLFNRVYSDKHYYLFHIDPVGSSKEFEKELRLMAKNLTNVWFAKDIPIVYGAATASILLTKTMAWFNRHATGWDYFVPLTGSDYPLLPLHRMEKIFNFQNPPMPFVMGWTPGTSTHIFRLEKTYPIFETDHYLKLSIKAVTDERGKLLGAVPMEYRSGNFGPPLFCNNKSNFYHLDNRFNKSNRVLDSQWLFPRDVFRGRGRAYAEEDRRYATPSFDGEWRVWKKSDPATTGAYDRETVDYIVNSHEGRRYYHFFKQMLLGSEEHYYISLLYNWNRTRAFVQTLSAEIVWNTWELGLWEPSGGGFQTHTHFLSTNEWDILQGFAKRGMMFARKFHSKKTASLLDEIDRTIHFNESTEAGLFWPGFYDVDITSPGKVWIAMYRQNMSMNAKKNKKNIARSKQLLKNSVVTKNSVS